MADHWVSDRPTAAVSTEGRKTAVRCLGCRELFYRPLESAATCPKCPPGTECSTNVWSTRWVRPA